ncbi:hypothetical protein QE611_09785, partial [Streptococcus suis]
MRKIFQDLNQEYLETRSSVGEDWLEWVIQRKMTWGMRWGLVGILMFVLQPLTYNPHFLLGCFLPFVKPFKVFDEQYFEFSSQNKEIILFWTKV